MSVYVDPLMEWGGSATFRWTHSCHMMADTNEELHKFAKRIGLKREWHQACPPHSVSHYDLNASRRRVAVHCGAIEVDLMFRPNVSPIIEDK